jgi:hypothetical protein
MTDGVRRLSHEEAEMLISARMDEQLDRADSRALLVHLQTCESCRAFAVQSEVLGRELAALPVLPPSALVDRQIRETIGKGRSRWSLAALMPATGGNSGLRVAVGALAMLTLVSVFLLVRMAGDQSGEGPSIDAPNGGVAQQIDRTPTDSSALLGESAGPTETPRVLVTQTTGSDTGNLPEPTQSSGVPTDVAVAQTDESSEPVVQPTRTLDSSFVYTIEKTPTPQGGGQTATESAETPPTEESGDVSVAAVMVDEGTPAEDSAATVAPDEASQGTVEPEESATVEESPEPTETPAAPTEEPTLEPTETPGPPTEAPATDVPATEEPTSTPAEPTATETPVEISVDPTEEPTATPEADESTEDIQVESPEVGSTPASADEPGGDESTEPEPTQTPSAPQATQTPAATFAQPTIAPMSGQSGTDQGSGESAVGSGGESPQIVASGDEGGEDSGEENGAASTGSAGIESSTGSDSGANSGGVANDSPPIVPSDGTNIPEGVGGDTGEDPQGGDEQEPSPIPTVDDSAEPSGLDLSDTVASLPSGTTSPIGRLEFSPGMNLYTVIAPDGQLAVADLDGELVVTLGNGQLPVWSGSGLMFSTPGEAGSEIGIWNSDSGELSYIPPSSDEASNDVPIGGDGSSFYFLRMYPDSGIVEIRSASIDGSDNGVLWTSDSVSLGGERPLYSDAGVYLPTESEWLFIDWSGGESSLGENPYGYVGAPVLSPGGGLMAYSVGDQVVVAWTDEPGVAAATAPFSAPGGYAFATSGEEIVVSDGSSLQVISYEGEDFGSLGGNQPIGGVYWVSDTIYYLQIGEDAALKSTSLGAIQSE